MNAATTLPSVLAALGAPPFDAEILLVDGGSSDDTRRVAAEGGAVVHSSPRGRGRQVATGIAHARSDWLLLLHADTRLSGNWAAAVADHIAVSGNRWRAGHFRFILDDDDMRARRVERLVAWRCRRLALPYGDQGLLIHRHLLDAAGGWRPLDLMEDVNLVARLGPRRLVALDADAVTSAARYRRDGYTRRPVRNVTLLILYFLGLPTALLKRLYG